MTEDQKKQAVKELKAISLLSKRANFSDTSFIQKTINKFEETNLNQTIYGKKFVKRLQNLYLGYNERTCIICGLNDTNNHILCPECIKKIDGSGALKTNKEVSNNITTSKSFEDDAETKSSNFEKDYSENIASNNKEYSNNNEKQIQNTIKKNNLYIIIGIILSVLMIIGIVYFFTASGTDPLSQQTMDEITALTETEITLEDEAMIEDLENTYSEMTDKQKEQVKNYVDLKNARRSLDALKEAEQKAAEEEAARIAAEKKKAEDEAAADELKKVTIMLPYSFVIRYVKNLKKSFNNPDSMQLHSVDHIFTRLNTSEGEKYCNICRFDISGENQAGGTTRKTFYVVGHSGTCLMEIESGRDYYESSEKMIMEMFDTRTYEELDVDLIMKYVDKEY